MQLTAHRQSIGVSLSHQTPVPDLDVMVLLPYLNLNA